MRAAGRPTKLLDMEQAAAVNGRGSPPTLSVLPADVSTSILGRAERECGARDPSARGSGARQTSCRAAARQLDDVKI